MTLWSCDMMIMIYDITHQGASCSLYTCHSIHIWSYFTWSSVLLLSLVSYLSVYIIVRFIIHWFQCSTYIYCPFAFTFSYYCFLFSCVHFWSTSDGPWLFSITAQGDYKPLFEETQEDYQAWVWVSCLMYFGILSCYDVPMPKLYLLLFLLCYVSNLVSRQRLL